MARLDIPRRMGPARPSPGRLPTAGGPAPWGSWPLLGVAAFWGLLCFYGLNAGDLGRTENLRALIATEVLRSGNWVVPRLYGEPLLTKPPGMYAAIALASWPAGRVCEWSARLPSAVAALLTLLLVQRHFCRCLGQRAGLVAALVLPTSVLWLDKATAAEIDMTQVAWVTGAILCFLRALEIAESPVPRPAWGWWLAALGCVAGGVLTKWTAPAFFYGTAVPLLWWRGRLRLLGRGPHLLGVALAAGLVFAWATLVAGYVGWHALYSTVSREGLARLIPSRYGQTYAWWLVPLHPFRLLAANLPTSGWAVLALRPGFARLWDERGRRLLQALHCWTWANMLLWSLVAEHAPRHSFPLSPGLAGLAALVWVAWLDRRLHWPLSRLAPGSLLAVLLIGWLGVKLVFVHVVLPARAAERQARAKGEQLAAAVPAGRTLYVLGLRDKDEGILFYYGRPVRRLPALGLAPLPAERLYCLLEEAEWRAWHAARPARVVLGLADEQGAPVVLVEVSEQGGGSARRPPALAAGP